MITIEYFQPVTSRKIHKHVGLTQVEYLIGQMNDIIFDVTLSDGTILREESVWTLLQKQELIISILCNRDIPPLSIVKQGNSMIRVIDGKQRLMSIISFILGNFDLEIEGEQINYRNMHESLKSTLNSFTITANIIHENSISLLTDDELISWLNEIRSWEHKQSLLNKL
jgi:hypothetical protein